MIHNIKNKSYCVHMVPWIMQVSTDYLKHNGNYGNQDYVSEIRCWKETNPSGFRQLICLTQ